MDAVEARIAELVEQAPPIPAALAALLVSTTRKTTEASSPASATA